MNRDSWIVICLAYIIGLFTTSLFYFSDVAFSLSIVLKIGFVFFLLCTITKFITKIDVTRKVWLSAILLAIFAVVYFNLRIPQPQQNDISLVASEKFQVIMVRGKVITEPRLNSSNKLQFWLQTNEIVRQDNSTQTVTGKLYVTLPLLQGNNLYPRQFISIKGYLYQPQAAADPTQFDFQKYLKERGTFAGLTGYEIVAQSEQIPWGWYRLRTRIIRAQVKGLGSPLGQLVSSMVLGRKAVDLPDDIRDLFIKSGLAHVLAASGFHVSLLLGIVLRLTNSFNGQKQAIISAITLFIYLSLTGFSPSVIRAVIMGIAVLIAMVNKARVRPLGSLLLAATLILLINPLWIWDLSFQLSFLATLGLIVTLPNLEHKLDWLPYNISTAIAIPLAASIWVLPLISYVFNTVATYSIIVNLIATPLITIISLGGMFSSAVALILPSLGSYLAWLIKYPTLLLITITKFFTSLPSSTWAVGTIPLWLLLFIYLSISLIWLNRKLQKKWWLFLIIILLLIISLRWQQSNLVRITIFDTSESPAIVIQDRGTVILINSGNSQTVKYTILPFLASQGINQINYWIAFGQQIDNLSFIKSSIAIDSLIIYSTNDSNKLVNKTELAFELNPTINTESLTIAKINHQNAIQLKINNERWLLTDSLSSLKTLQLERYEVLLWLSQELDDRTVREFEGIAIANRIEGAKLARSLKLYATDRYGTIIWQPQTGFTTMTQEAYRNNILR